MSEEKRVLVIGIDGATFDLLLPLMERGQLPTLRKIREEGFSSTLLSTVPPISAPAWTTFITGKNPGKHGILQFVNIKPWVVESEEEIEVFPGGFAVINATSIKERALWQIIGERGKRVGIINVPICYPPSEVNGFMIAGMLTPPGAKVFTYPPGLGASLGDYEIELSLEEREFTFPPDILLKRLTETMEKRAAVTLRLIREEPWDFFVVVFTETDRLQHRFFRYLDPQASDYDSPESRHYREEVEHFFQRLDEIVGMLIHEADATSMILSDHGFGPAARRSVYKGVLLQELGLTQGTANWGTRTRYFLERYLGLDREKVYRYFGWAIPRALLGAAMQRVKWAERRAWARSRAYLVTLHEYIGGLSINVKDGQGSGIVEPGSEYEELREDLVARLEALRDPDTGCKLVEKVYPREELYHGHLLSQCPDIVFFLAPGYGLVGGSSGSGRLVEPAKSVPEKQGTHRAEGILSLIGPGVERKRASQVYKLEDASATALYLLGVPIPSDMDGAVISEAFSPQFLEAQPVRYQEVQIPEEEGAKEPAPSVWASEKEMEEVKRRLRGIGYLE